MRCTPQRFDDAKLDELARSISANGVVQPLLLRRKGSRFELIAGERRWRAAQRAGLAKVPAIIRTVSDDKVLELALIENIQREDLNPIEEARAYKKLIDTIGLTQETVAERVGRDRSYVTNYLRLFACLERPSDLLRAGGSLRVMLERFSERTPDTSTPAGQEGIEQACRSEPLSACQTVFRTQTHDGAQGVKPNRATLTFELPNKLRREFGTQVRICASSGKPGRKD